MIIDSIILQLQLTQKQLRAKNGSAKLHRIVAIQNLNCVAFA
jgi:hypothetical protein